MSDYGLRLLKQLKFGTFETDKPINYRNRNTARQQCAQVSNVFFQNTVHLALGNKYLENVTILPSDLFPLFNCLHSIVFLKFCSCLLLSKNNGSEVVLLLFWNFNPFFQNYYSSAFTLLNLTFVMFFQVNQFLLDLATLIAEEQGKFQLHIKNTPNKPIEYDNRSPTKQFCTQVQNIFF